MRTLPWWWFGWWGKLVWRKLVTWTVWRRGRRLLPWRLSTSLNSFLLWGGWRRFFWGHFRGLLSWFLWHHLDRGARRSTSFSEIMNILQLETGRQTASAEITGANLYLFVLIKCNTSLKSNCLERFDLSLWLLLRKKQFRELTLPRNVIFVI